ncbi:MAG TPA: CHAT domain-containing protein, partial [Thermoanaerobaculia bacterium]|nr:CHAT domain-containing protein [Thermoanaerobaculia bacterium]
RALAIQEETAPESLEVAQTLNQLGSLAEKRGDFAAAEDHHRSALYITEKLAHGTSDTSYESVYNLWNLAAVEQRKGDLAKADEYLQRIMEVESRISPESYAIGVAYFYRALFAAEQGNMVLAQELQGRALAILEKQAPGSLRVSDSLDSLGAIAFERGDLPKAEELFQRALAIRDQIAPGSTRLGVSLNNLGRVYRRAGRLAMAADYLCSATEAFDKQRKTLGGTIEGGSAFSGTTAEYYRDCLAALIDISRPEEALRVLERGRARSFLDLLAERDLSWTADLPPELARDRKLTNSEYDRTQAALERLSPARDQAEIDRLLVRLREFRARQEDLAAKIRQISPRAAAVHDPKPLDLAGARDALDPGTLLLAWSIGRERSFLFVIQPPGTNPGLEVLPLAVSDQALRERVGIFLNLLQRADSDRAALSGQARELYDLLLRPAEARIVAAKRLLISPDGPLHILPFAALVHDGHYLAEKKPIHTVISATVYAELKRSRRERSSTPQQVELAAFGDPSYPPLPSGQLSAVHAEVRAAVGRGLALTPLPSTREEVRDIAALYPEARTFLGTEATEERAKSIGKDARYLHFACHGLLDERFPLNSALALTIPVSPGESQDNGLLQAWEIFERVRLDADLVTLFACDTALGQEMGGEGLLGLTRAFQYAGARSVLASLWSVSDISTAALMKRFYGYLRKGRSKDEALRAAQADLIRSQGFSHPYYWAAFQLTGDWK